MGLPIGVTNALDRNRWGERLNVTNTPAGNMLPGTNRGSAVPRTETEVKDPMEEAYERRKEGKVVDPVQGMNDAYEKAIDDYNTQHGTTFSADDFQHAE